MRDALWPAIIPTSCQQSTYDRTFPAGSASMSERTERWRARARQMRATAQQAQDPAAKANLLKFADQWDAMADQDDARDKSSLKRPPPG